MKGDFSKDNFDKSKQYTSVRMQQGRVQLDSDWNEQIDIFNHRTQVENTDFIGGSGTPIGNQGYNITLTTDKKNFNISQGRYYVNGVLAESPKVASYTTQPDWPNAVLPTTTGLYLAYLDIWQRGVSAIEDPSIREVALSGTDTTTRVKNVAQVKLVKLATDPTGINLSCNTVINNTTSNKTIWDNTKVASTGQMTINVSSAANFSNQLYRVEIHDSGSESQATFKWSRDNGSVLASISKIDEDVLTFKSLHTQESGLEFKASQWVELNTRTRELHGKPGIFVQLLRVDNNTATVTSWPTLLDGKATTKTALATEFSKEGTMRRWDSVKTFVLKSNTASFLAISNFKKTGSNITLDLPSANDTNTFTVGQFVELRHDKTQVGIFAQLKNVSGKTLTLESGSSFPNTPKFIRAAGTAATVVDNADQFIALEEGLEIKFSTGTYKTGDYWLILTRATNIAEWPKTNNQFVEQRAKGIHHDYTPLSLLRLAADNTWTIAGDCRTVFSPLINRGVQVDAGANSASVVIDTNSNVGIGTSTPKNKLDVEGNAAIGTTYSGTNTAPANGLIVEGNVGIGTNDPKNKLDIEGGAAIGSTYSGTNTAPSNGLIVEGNVGIGTNSPTQKLEVNGKTKTTNLEVTGTTTLKGNTTTEGDVTIGNNKNLIVNNQLQFSDAIVGKKIALHSDFSMGIQLNTQYFRTQKNFAWYKGGEDNLAELHAGGGTVQMVIKDGNVGIGTNDPKNKLDVEGNVAIGTTYSGTNTAPANGLIVEGSVGIGTNDPKSKLDVEGNVAIGNTYSGTNTAPLNGLIVEGNVGIGTNDPKSKLDVEGNVAIGNTYSGTNTAPSNGLIVEGNVGIGTNDPKSKLDVEGNVAIGNTYSGTNTAPPNGLIVEGNVGIGTNDPKSKLDVEGNVAIGNTYSGTNTAPSNGLIVEGNVGIGTNDPKSKLDVEGNVAIGNTYSGTNTAPSNGLIVEGNVGIGTNSPTQKLEVNGNITSSGTMTLTSATDTTIRAPLSINVKSNTYD